MKLMRVAPLLLLLLLVQAPAVAEGDAAEARTYNYLLTYFGSKVGWAKSTVSEVELDGAKAILEHEEMYLVIKRSFDGASFKVTGTTDTWYTPAWQEIRKVDVTVNGNQTATVETTYGETIKISETVDKGKPTVTELKRGDKPVYGNMSAWLKLKAGKLEPGTKLEFAAIEADEHAIIDETWTVNGRVKRKLIGGDVKEGVQVSMLRAGRASTVIFGDDDMPLYYESAAGFALERVDKIPHPFVPEQVSMRTVMESNVAVPSFQTLESMQVEMDYEHDDGDGLPALFDTCAYHDVVKFDEGYALLLKASRLSDTAAKLAYPLAEVADDVKPLLKATAMCQSDDADLLAEATKLAKGKKTGAEVARALIEFVGKRLRGGSGDTGSASAKQAYKERMGDCTEHAALFVALARAAGLPARNAGGIVYVTMGDDGIFGYHAWAEVWLGEWVPVDSTVGELGTSARYFLLEYDEPGVTHGRGRSARCIRQDIQPLVNAYQLESGKQWQRKGAKDRFAKEPEKEK